MVDLRDLCSGSRPGLSAAKGASLAEAAAVCLDLRGHRPGAALRVRDNREFRRTLHWQPASRQTRGTYADIAEATEEGACAIAIAAIENARGLVVMERSRKRSAFDYWLGDPHEAGEALPFYRTVRLEVSGILEGSPAAIEQRVDEKLERLRRYPSRLPAIVAVVEFGTPQVRIHST